MNVVLGVGKVVVDGEFVKLFISLLLCRFDKGGDEFYW